MKKIRPHRKPLIKIGNKIETGNLSAENNEEELDDDSDSDN